MKSIGDYSFISFELETFWSAIVAIANLPTGIKLIGSLICILTTLRNGKLDWESLKRARLSKDYLKITTYAISLLGQACQIAGLLIDVADSICRLSHNPIDLLYITGHKALGVGFACVATGSILRTVDGTVSMYCKKKYSKKLP